MGSEMCIRDRFTVDARLFAESFYYFLCFVAGTYFLYLYFLAGLNSNEKKNLVLLALLFIGAAAFWSGFDQSASSLSIFARDYTDLSVSGYIIPIGWLQFANPILWLFLPLFLPAPGCILPKETLIHHYR